MSGEGLYERYKDALKRGHVAALRGRLDEAIDAYAEASRIAPERSTPHTAAGTALMRRKRPADALAYYEAAAKLGPRDEAALVGRAQALVALDRRSEAAEAYDALAELRAAGGKPSDAVDAARRALELAEGRERRRTLERLISRLRATRTDEPARVAMERALRVLEGPSKPAASRLTPIDDDVLAAAVAAEEAAAARDARAAAAQADEVEAPEAPEPEPSEPEPPAFEDAAPDAAEPEAPESPEAAAADTVVEDKGADEPWPEADLGIAAAVAEDKGAEDKGAEDKGADEAWPEADLGIAAALAAVDLEPEEAPVPGAAPVAAVAPGPGILERDLPPGMSLDQLARLAEAALDGDDAALAVDRLLDLAAANRLYGTQDAAIDACYQGLSLQPDDVGLHLALVQLYDEHGWRTLASEKLGLLGRLVDLQDDPGAQAKVEAARGSRP